MYCYGYTGRLRTDYRDCFGGYRDRLHENHQVGLKLYGLRTLKVLWGKQGQAEDHTSSMIAFGVG